MRRIICLICIFLLCAYWIACVAEIDGNQPTPTVEPEPTPTAEPEPTPTAEPEPTPTVEPEPTPTAEPEPTPTKGLALTIDPFSLMPTVLDEPLVAPVYDVSISFDNDVAYSYSGEYRHNDYSGISGDWIDNTASVTVSCGTSSDPVKVYITTSSLEAAIQDVLTGKAYVNISASNNYTQSNPAILHAGENATVVYTASGTIPFDATLSDGQGDGFSPCDFIGSTTSDISLLTINVYIDAVDG